MILRTDRGPSRPSAAMQEASDALAEFIEQTARMYAEIAKPVDPRAPYTGPKRRARRDHR